MRKLTLGIALVIGCAFLSASCATMGILAWSHDEVAVEHGQVRVKNVTGVADGSYSVVGPETVPQEPVVEAADGILSLSQPLELSLTLGRSDDSGAIDIREMDLSDARQPFAPGGKVVTATVACVEKDEGRHYRVHVLRGDSERQRWVRVGTIDLGTGTQSAARRPVSWAALPFTVAVDILSLPILLVGALGVGVFEGISALSGG